MFEFEADGGSYLAINVTQYKMVQIETAYTYLNFAPVDARAIAAALIKTADEAEAGQ